jgi:hypothetical protein
MNHCASDVATGLLRGLPELPKSTQLYLSSIVALHTIVPDVKGRVNRLLHMFKKEKEAGLKGMLATLDLMFLTASRDVSKLGKELGSDDPEFFEAEEYAEGFSYALHLYWEQVGIPQYNRILDPKAVRRNAYLLYLLDAAHVRAFHEVEVLVDAFGYTLAFDETLAVRVPQPKSPSGKNKPVLPVAEKVIEESGANSLFGMARKSKRESAPDSCDPGRESRRAFVPDCGMGVEHDANHPMSSHGNLPTFHGAPRQSLPR